MGTVLVRVARLAFAGLGIAAISLARGAAVHWYPYPFLNPTHPGGYGRVVIYAVVLAVFMGVLALAVNAIARRRAGAAS